ncbi:hypothetical protein EYZ11_003797 [Aspergillus tanneri]|uniref:Amino acid permease/ SLC12A domain-containing protein n=1 Tax=Aspergillus tanneri TaxID=1220188 RepID=A0A4S3JM75_9EURO|nr:hypothetical protein EYZ11_003797 [Aspergillus tanneri]
MNKESCELEEQVQSSDPRERNVTRTKDDQELVRVGKVPSLQRRFGFLSIIGFSCTVLATWEGVLSGGSGGAVYSYLFVWFGTLCTLVTLSELVSMAPTSGGQYHWVAILSPRWCHKFLSFITGWLIILGWLGGLASGAYLASSQILGFVAIAHASFEPQPYQIMLLFWAYVAFAVFINLGAGTLLPKFEGFALVLHIAATLLST